MPSGTEWLWVVGCLAVMVLVEPVLRIASRLPIYPQLMKFLGGRDPDYPKPALDENETVLREDRAEFTRSLHGGTGGPIILTNRRIIWYEDRSYVPWPFKRTSKEFKLEDLASADKSSPLEHVFGGRRLRLRLRGGKNQCLWVDGLDEWIKTICIAIAGAGGRSE